MISQTVNQDFAGAVLTYRDEVLDAWSDSPKWG